MGSQNHHRLLTVTPKMKIHHPPQRKFGGRVLLERMATLNLRSLVVLTVVMRQLVMRETKRQRKPRRVRRTRRMEQRRTCRSATNHWKS